jgi:hypothetical protein
MAALIQGCLRINPDSLSEDEFAIMWGRTKFYLETVHQVNFT